MKSDLWFSKEPFFEGEDVQVFTALYNSSGQSVKGSVVFYVDGERFDNTDFSIQPAGAQVLYGTWKASSGNHSFSAGVENIQARDENGNWTSADIEYGQASNETRFVDLDTDKDGVGNLVDNDDDGDGIDDAEDSEPLIAFVPSEDGPNIASGNFIENVIETIQEKVFPKTKDILEDTIEETEEFRESQKEKTEERVDKIEKKISETRNIEAPYEDENLSILDRLKNFAASSIAASEGTDKNPLAHLWLWAQKAFLLALENKYIFYTILGAILLFIARFIFKKIF